MEDRIKQLETMIIEMAARYKIDKANIANLLLLIKFKIENMYDYVPDKAISKGIAPQNRELDKIEQELDGIRYEIEDFLEKYKNNL